MQGMEIRIGNDKTLKFNLAITKSFNADFDGDEMNIYVPQTPGAQADVKHLMVATNNIMSRQTGEPFIGVVQDACLGVYLMTKNNWCIDLGTFNDILMEIKFTHTGQHFCLSSALKNIRRVLSLKDVPYKKLSGRTLMSLILPRYFSLETDTVKIYDGVIYDGFVDKTTTNRIVKTVHNTFSNLHAADLIDNMQFITRRFLLRFGFTIGLDDCETTAVTNDETYLEQAKMYKGNEAKIMTCLNNAKNKGAKTAKDSLRGGNHFSDTILSGSKGDWSNVTQIMGLLGQQNLKCGRPTDSLQYVHKDEFEARGFICSNFMSGSLNCNRSGTITSVF